VLELSSYQLDLVHNLPLKTAVFLNVSPDHLDRHGDMNGYVEAKKRIFSDLTRGTTAVVGLDCNICPLLARDLASLGKFKVIEISGSIPAHGGVYAMDGMLVNDLDHRRRSVGDLKLIPTLAGTHNYQNAAAAFAAAVSVEIKPDQAIAAIKTFPGLAHRQELIDRINGVSYVNDSKATNAEAAAKALSSYQDIYWIAGGQAKDGGIEGLNGELASVRHAYLIGEAAEDFAKALEGKVSYTIAKTLNEAVEQASAQASSSEKGGVVLLSPACASFDQFKDFEARGEAFREIVQGLSSGKGGFR